MSSESGQLIKISDLALSTAASHYLVYRKNIAARKDAKALIKWLIAEALESEKSLPKNIVIKPPPLAQAALRPRGSFVINGQCPSDQNGVSVSAAGDVNGDGSNSTEFEIESDSRWTAPTATLRRVGPVARVPDDTIGPWAGPANQV